MKNISLEQRKKEIQSITLWGSMVNILLMAVKFVAGLLSRSSALVADGIHSLSDLATDFIVLISSRISNRPADDTHPYGHKRFETLSAQLIAMILMLVGVGLVRSSVLSLIRQEQRYPGFVVLIVALLSIFLKEILFRATRRVSSRVNSAALYANAWHHRTDALSSIAVFGGGIASLLGWGYADQVATIAVAVMIFTVGWKIFYECLRELTEHSACRESVETIERILNEESRLAGWQQLRTRRLGGELFVDAHVLVDPELTVRQSHDITIDLEARIKRDLTKPAHVLIHVDPAGVERA